MSDSETERKNRVVRIASSVVIWVAIVAFAFSLPRLADFTGAPVENVYFLGVVVGIGVGLVLSAAGENAGDALWASKMDSKVIEGLLIRYYRAWEPYWLAFAVSPIALFALDYIVPVPSLAFVALALTILPALMGNMLVQGAQEA